MMSDLSKMRCALSTAALMFLFVVPAFAQDVPAKQVIGSKAKPKVTTFGNWSLICPPDGDTSAAHCFGQLSLINQKQKAAVVVWRVGFDKNRKLLTDMITPTEVFVAPGVQLTVGAATINLPYVSCGLQGCQSRVLVDAKMLGAMKTAQEGSISLAATNGKKLQLKLKVSGLADILKVLTNG
jgi:invasion protein IalB